MAATEERLGQWGPVVTFPNVGVHVHVLPDGRVLMWGRRDKPDGGFDEDFCKPFVWDPADPTHPPQPGQAPTAKTVATPQPRLANGHTVNLFCGGHAFLPDGRLLVVGGHIRDGVGVNQASIYDSAGGPDGAGTWQATSLMNNGRWYPTALTLPDGSVVTLSGSFLRPDGKTEPNEEPQVWFDGAWRNLAVFNDNGRPLALELYPRVHLKSDGQVFMSGPQQFGWLLDTNGGGRWRRVDTARHEIGQLDYAPAVMYDVDKIIYIGGGGGDENKPVEPTNTVEIIDLQATPLVWRRTDPMTFPRRQHNATLLADGTVLVTGGTKGKGFNRLDIGQPIRAAELWNPDTGKWTVLAEESVDRCYHSTAVLLPDASVLSSGGGEFGDVAAKDVHRNAQIFSPPYLFKGERPTITSAPTTAIHYGDTFEVGSPQAGSITTVTWIRLSSVTHAFNSSQRINFLEFRTTGDALSVTAPASPNVCPPGHYMLFVLNDKGVPSIAEIIHIASDAAPRGMPEAAPAEPAVPLDAGENVSGPAVVVGLTSTCPYGLAACWGGANEALNQLDDVGWVNPVADADDSTAEVFLDRPRLPPVNRWVEQFDEMVNGRYGWRGVEITLSGAVELRDGGLVLAVSLDDRPVRLAPLSAEEKIQFDNTTRVRKPLSGSESRAFDELSAELNDVPSGHRITVTGPLEETPFGYVLHVRQYVS